MADLEGHRATPRRMTLVASVAHGRPIVISRIAILVCVLLAGAGAPASVRAVQYDPPWLDAIWNHFTNPPDPSTLDTHGTMNEVRDTFDYYLSGYHTFSTTAQTATAALGSDYAQVDAIWWLASHGCEGCMELINTNSVVSDIWIDAATAGTINHTCSTGEDECLTSKTFNQMHDVKLMVYMGCNTGNAVPSGRTLQSYSTGVLGVDSAIAFTDLIDFSATTSDKWAHYFSMYLVFGYSVSSAASAAAQAVHNATGSYHGYNSYITSHGSTYVVPAGYGS